jgi:hypothetical protein
MAAVGMPLLAVDVLRASTFAASALTAADFLPWLLIGLPVGAWVDRLPPRPVLIISDVVSAVLYASLPVAAWAHVLTIGQVLVVALVAGASGIFHDCLLRVSAGAGASRRLARRQCQAVGQPIGCVDQILRRRDLPTSATPDLARSAG